MKKEYRDILITLAIVCLFATFFGQPWWLPLIVVGGFTFIITIVLTVMAYLKDRSVCKNE